MKKLILVGGLLLAVTAQAVVPLFLTTRTNAVAILVGGTLQSNLTNYDAATISVSNLFSYTSQVIDITKPPYNAIGDGATDSTAAITNALAASAFYGVPVIVPAQTFMCHPFTMHNNQSLIGYTGARLLFTNAAAANAITMYYNDTNMAVCNLELDGGNPDTTPLANDGRIGLLIWNCQNKGWKVSHLYVHGFGTGIQVYGLGSNVSPMLSLSECVLRWNFTGLYIQGQAEYLTTTGLKVEFNNTGATVAGGNCYFSACDFSRNNFNLNLTLEGNSGHGAFSACAFNHAGVMALTANNINFGEVFTGCAFLPPTMAVTNVQAFSFINCLLGWNTTNTSLVSFNSSTNCNIIYPVNPYGSANTYLVQSNSCLNFRIIY